MIEKFKILIVEDDILYADKLEELVAKNGCTTMGIAASAKEVDTIVECDFPDLVLMDIQLKGPKSGLDIAKMLTKIDPFLPVIFITAYKKPEFFAIAQKLGAYAYLTKPFDSVILERTIILALERKSMLQRKPQQMLEPSNERLLKTNGVFCKDYFFVKDKGLLQKINVQQIKYLSAEDKYVIVHVSQRKFAIRRTLKEFLASVKDENFMQVHRSFIVNFPYVNAINTKNNFLLIEESSIPIGRSYREKLKDRLKQFVG